MNKLVFLYLKEFHKTMWPHIKKGATKFEVHKRCVTPGMKDPKDGKPFPDGISKRGFTVCLTAQDPKKHKLGEGYIIPIFFPESDETVAQRVAFELQLYIDGGFILKDPAPKVAPSKRNQAKPKSKAKTGSKSRKR